MKLRQQLLLTGLVLLLLPWGAWQYLKGFDNVLRASQGQSLMAQAQLLADRLGIAPQLLNSRMQQVSADTQVLYAPTLPNSPLIDGYDDDWRRFGLTTSSLSAENGGQLQLSIGLVGQQLFAFITVADPALYYFNPSVDDPLAYDHLQLQLFNAAGESRRYFLQTSAPGTLKAQYRDKDGRWRSYVNIKGQWRENALGYQVELAIDLTDVQHGFNIRLIDRQPQQTHRQLLSERMLQLLHMDEQLQAFLDERRLADASVHLLNRDRWPMASAQVRSQTALQTPSRTTLQASEVSGLPWPVEWFYRRALTAESLPVLPQQASLSQWAYPELQITAPALGWYRSEQKTVAIAAAPIIAAANQTGIAGEHLGYVVLEKTTDQLIALTGSAFSRLFLYTFGAIFLVLLVLLGYASWLALRIRRLNRATINVVDDKGLIDMTEQRWPDKSGSDELATLSQSYWQLLLRLQGYQDYLRTLSGKLSHELRTPIAVVRSSLDNLAEVDSPELQQQYAQRARQGIQRLQGIINAMSEASRIEESVQHAEFSPVDIGELLTALTPSYDDAYPNHRILYRDQRSSGFANTHIMANLAEELFVQMLDKLIANAVDFSAPDDPIVIGLDADEQQLSIHIDNIGPPLPAMEEDLFESLVSLRQRSAAQDDGQVHLGLGLTIVRLIALKHQGRATAANRSDGQGVVFSVMLPRVYSATAGQSP